MSKIRKVDIANPDENDAEIDAAVSPNAVSMADGTIVSAMIWFGQSYNEGISVLGQEMLNFSRTRLSRGAVAAQSLARCKDWSEAVKIQQSWMKSAAVEYVTEMGKLFQLAMKTTVDSCRPLQDQAETAWGAASAGERALGD